MSRRDTVIPAFAANFANLFAAAESQLLLDRRSDFNKLNDVHSFEFLGEAYYGVRPSALALPAAGQPRPPSGSSCSSAHS